MNVVRATGQSVNQAFVNMASRVDFCAIFDTAYNMGITEDGEVPSPFPANILGSVSSSPLQMASVFGAIANSGQQCTPQSIESVTDRDENVLKEFSADCKEVISADVANKTAALLTASAGQYYTSTRLGDGRPLRRQVGYDRRPRKHLADRLHPLRRHIRVGGPRCELLAGSRFRDHQRQVLR